MGDQRVHLVRLEAEGGGHGIETVPGPAILDLVEGQDRKLDLDPGRIGRASGIDPPSGGVPACDRKLLQRLQASHFSKSRFTKGVSRVRLN